MLYQDRKYINRSDPLTWPEVKIVQVDYYDGVEYPPDSEVDDGISPWLLYGVPALVIILIIIIVATILCHKRRQRVLMGENGPSISRSQNSVSSISGVSRSVRSSGISSRPPDLLSAPSRRTSMASRSGNPSLLVTSVSQSHKPSNASSTNSSKPSSVHSNRVSGFSSVRTNKLSGASGSGAYSTSHQSAPMAAKQVASTASAIGKILTYKGQRTSTAPPSSSKPR